MSSQPVQEKFLPNQFDFDPLRSAATLNACCSRMQELIGQMQDRGYGFYIKEAREFCAIPFINENIDNPQLYSLFSQLIQTHNTLVTKCSTGLYPSV